MKKLIILPLLLFMFGSNFSNVNAQEENPQETSLEDKSEQSPQQKELLRTNLPYTDELINYPGIQIINSNDSIPSTYSFMPNLSKSTPEAFGNANDLGNYYQFNYADIANGISGARFNDVGTYKGKKVDLKITIEGYQVIGSYAEDSIYIRLYKKSMSLYLNHASFKLKYSYYEHGTNTPMVVAGYHNFKDIDFNQSIKIYSDMNLHQLYTTSDNALAYLQESDYLQIGDDDGVATNDNDKPNWLNYTYDETSSFTLMFGTSTNGDAAFTYTYEALVAVTKPVTIMYVNEQGVEIASSDILTGSYGETYQTNPKTINGYELKETPSNSTGYFSDQEQVVTYLYKPAVVISPSPTPTNIKVSTPKTNDTTNITISIIGILGSGFMLLNLRRKKSKC